MKTYDEINSYINEVCECTKDFSDLSESEFYNFLNNFIALEKGEKMLILETIIDNISVEKLKSIEYSNFFKNEDVSALLKEMVSEE